MNAGTLELSILIIFISLCAGSFLNVVIYRLPRGQSVVWPGSYCPRCGHGLGILDLIPLFSYIILGGKCRYCQQTIARQYPLVELGTALAFYLIYWQRGFGIEMIAGWLLFSFLLTAALIDVAAAIIPDWITFPGMAAGILLAPYTIGWQDALLGMFFLGGFFLLVLLLSRGGMGGGDVKLAGLIGSFCGLRGALLVFLLSSLSGGVWALYLLLVQGANGKTAVRFGPFLSGAAFLVWLVGEELWYYLWF
ncbi:MAG TPA: prepilin peptidase [Syntrophomonadaceae bacterium]|nr:prepilin peptidase [Syntrophomonadaceae bacterium]